MPDVALVFNDNLPQLWGLLKTIIRSFRTAPSQ